MADETPLPTTEEVLLPLRFGAQLGAPEHYPFLFGFTGEDVLELTSWNSAAGVEVTLQGRIHVGPGDVKPFTLKQTANTDRTPKTSVVSMPRGELLNCIVFASAGAPVLGQTFARVVVRRGAGDAFERLGILIQRPVTASIGAAFPGSTIVSPFEAEPFTRAIQGTTPGAGNPINEVVPTGARWEVRSLAFTMLMAGGAQVVPVQFQDASANLLGGAITGQFHSGGGSTFNVLFTANWTQPYNTGVAPSAPTMYQGLPYPMVLLAGQKIVVPAVGAPTYTNVFYTVREWLDI